MDSQQYSLSFEFHLFNFIEIYKFKNDKNEQFSQSKIRIYKIEYEKYEKFRHSSKLSSKSGFVVKIKIGLFYRR